MLAAENIYPNIYPLSYAIPPDDARRVSALQRYHVLDTPACEEFTFLTELAAQLCGVPYAFITLVDAGRAWVKAATGLALDTLPREQSYCSLAVLGQQATEIEDLSADPRTAEMPLTVSAPHMRMYSSVALTAPDGYAIGALSVMDSRPGRLGPEQARSLRRLAAQAMALLEARAARHALQAARAELAELSTTDELTGLHNRRSLLGKLSFEVARTRRFRTPLSALIIDLDGFKAVNERHGSDAGDLVLANVGRLVRENVRVIDLAGRYGGQEICVLLPNTPLEGALKLAENLRAKLAAQIHREAGRLLPVTASIGVGAFNHMDISDGDSLLRQAEQALARAKASGRDRVES
ncbi:sensor domain-containing diguanylate cyclase [Pseudoduganella aquatica]|uniref:diguanylate cyclase n=1 Tax=Pseudoduganella aquatica TaxID=2660641 RepID=A0A7X4KMU7_9BURK|nr:sensor domain-containing diguanylate cyclase [Pseudoduganella aquatica]MYN09624.1 diguanylate cyclase [Pseudoduganella aquatica]